MPRDAMRNGLCVRLLLTMSVLAAVVSTTPAAGPVIADPPAFKSLKYRSIGPAAGGRVCRVVGVPGDPMTYYTATAAGGVWKSADGGLTWSACTDSQPLASVGSIAVAPSNPNVVYAGGGEANIRGDVAVGNGIYKSTDAGKTWKHVWQQQGQIGTLIVHPSNADIAFAAVLGHAFGPNPERGIYRTTDGGKTWQRVLFKDENTGASDVCFDLTNPQILFAGLWQTRRRPWELTSGGPGSGLYMSRDGGDTWKQLGGGTFPEPTGDAPGKGLPDGTWGKIGLGVAPSDGRRVYALIEADKGGLYRSNDGGDTWSLVSSQQVLRQRAWYYTTLTIDPKNPDVVWCPQVSLLRSIDGGRNFQPLFGPHHGDHHDLWIDPQNPRRMINGSDGGVDITTNGGESWYAPALPISQFYHVAADNSTPYHVSGAMQDLGTASGPSDSLSFGGIARSDWTDVGGGESGFTAYDPKDPNIVYAGSYGGYITRYDLRTHQAHSISIYPVTAVGRGGEELRYRFQWTAPIFISPHDSKVIYHAANVVFQTQDGGRHWAPISPDLTRNDKSKQKWTGGPITGDNTGAEIYCTVFALAESPKEKGLLWAGSDDGLVHVSRDGGKTWTNVTARITGLPEWGTVNCIETSPFDAGTAYVVVDAHRLDDMRPYLFKTADYGKTWKSLTAKLPQDTYLHAVREDPKRKGFLYVGSALGVAFSADDGDTWQALKLNLPPVPVHDLVVKDNDLVVGTHGRSIWILDDLTAVRRLSPRIAARDVHLFPAQKAIRYRLRGGRGGEGAGANPPRGAVFQYYLKSKPKGDLTLEIRDARGALVRKLSSKPKTPPAGGAPAGGRRRRTSGGPLTTEPGVNRIVWDLTYEAPETIAGSIGWPGGPTSGPEVNPGRYAVKLLAEGKTLTTTVLVEADPRVQVSPAELDEQLKLALAVREQITHLTRIVEQIRSLKQQITSKNELLKDNAAAKPVVDLGKEVIGKLDGLEARLHNPKAKIPYDLLAHKGGAQIYSQLSNLFYGLQGSDGAPTQGMLELYGEETSALQRVEAEFKNLQVSELTRLNDLAKKLEIPAIVVPEKAKSGKKS